MKAIQYHGVRSLELVDIEKPKAAAGQVLVKVEYCGMCGTDIHAYSTPGIFDWELVLGHEIVGRIEEIGPGVEGFSVGERVAVGPPGDCGKCYSCNTGHPNTCAHGFPNTLGIGPNTQGGYAEYVLSRFPQNELFKIPDNVTFEQAVLFDVLGVGFHAVRRSNMRVGDNVMVSGCGSIGLSVIQAAKMAGARNLVAFDYMESRRESALAAGADFALDPGNEDDLKHAREIFAREDGAQVTFEAAGHPSSVQSCIDFLMPNGQVMLIGSDGRPFELVTAALGPMEYDLKFSFTYTKDEIAMLFELISLQKLDTSIYSLEKAPLSKAIEKMDELSSGKLDVARVLLAPGLN